ncbi:phosphosulfolactate synthase [Pseudonocardia sp. RS11V-5]|uniref:phosphosulfolactate synthase n=1 Tax=Pseudonocardia terrae TaxID=2905831 RepID=UPI001E4B816B|nr:phosphosulfolactate synthase [Pseudonocardia terrae]MCE3555684.1 phosphosulfolactate synthase [Pseudonocardia terrae]
MSNGTIPMGNAEKARWISRLAEDFTVVSEVGFKDQGRSADMTPAEWIEAIRSDFAAGAAIVTTEARESGRSGLCTSDGRPRHDVLDDVLATGVDVDRMLFEAPTKELQVWFLQRLGTAANLGNVAAADVIGLETLRLGLRSDTLRTGR